MGYIEDLRGIVGNRPLIFVGSVTIIIDQAGRLLLQLRKFPNGYWGIPGGLMELGESTEDVAKREIFEETGLIVDHLNLINFYSGPQNFVKAENGDEFFVVTVAYYTKEYKGKLSVNDSESIKFEFFYPNELPKNIVKSHKVILNEFLTKFYPKLGYE
ncbi:NUDIX hydrolase [Gottfriedia acidiceleris]|uniref:NUDIX hydrolase n=1 Tax=Gottfriedia acidiceleris TaxID=371036 RepID=UPI002FFF80E1